MRANVLLLGQLKPSRLYALGIASLINVIHKEHISCEKILSGSVGDMMSKRHHITCSSHTCQAQLKHVENKFSPCVAPRNQRCYW